MSRIRFVQADQRQFSSTLAAPAKPGNGRPRKKRHAEQGARIERSTMVRRKRDRFILSFR